jgi:hypothetical protein
VLLHAHKDLVVPLVGLFGVLLVLYEFPSEQAGSSADLFVDLRSRNLPPDLTERPCPRLGMQVVGVHQRPFYLQHDDSCHRKPPRLLFAHALK